MNKDTLKATLENLFTEAETMKNAYFFKPPVNASARRSYEKHHSISEFSWTENDHEYSAEFVVECSCKNVYAYGIYKRDGKKTTLTAIKNSYHRMFGV